jgi:hypothetical protein
MVLTDAADADDPTSVGISALPAGRCENHADLGTTRAASRRLGALKPSARRRGNVTSPLRETTMIEDGPRVGRRGRGLLVLVVAVLLVLVLTGCAPGPNPQAGTTAASGATAGFWFGLWHGLIAPVTFVISLFNADVGIYEVHNSGSWYDFGFVLGLGFLVGGGSGASSARR